MKTYAISGKPRAVGGWHPPASTPRRTMEEPAIDGVASSSNLDGYAPPAQDQSHVGMCTSEGALSTRECLVLRSFAQSLRIDTLDAAQKTAALAAKGGPFSRLYQYARTRQREGTPLDADTGASGADAFAVMENMGTCPVSAWSDADPDTRYMLDPGPECDTEAHKHRVVLSFGLPSLRTILASLTQGFPVGFGFTVYANMMSEECARTGIVHMPTENEEVIGGHFAFLLGHDDSFLIDNVKGAARARNSWSKAWGINGDFWVPYGYFEKGYADDAHTCRRADQ